MKEQLLWSHDYNSTNEKLFSMILQCYKTLVWQKQSIMLFRLNNCEWTSSIKPYSNTIRDRIKTTLMAFLNHLLFLRKCLISPATSQLLYGNICICNGLYGHHKFLPISLYFINQPVFMMYLSGIWNHKISSRHFCHVIGILTWSYKYWLLHIIIAIRLELVSLADKI